MLLSELNKKLEYLEMQDEGMALNESDAQGVVKRIQLQRKVLKNTIEEIRAIAQALEEFTEERANVPIH